MKLLDTTTINYIMKNNISISGEYFITPDIEEEMLVAEIALDKKSPPNIKSVLLRNGFDEALYVKNYFTALNKYGGKSFFNMTGFGDISLIALVMTLIEITQLMGTQSMLPGLSEQIDVYTGDVGLEKKLKKVVSANVNLFKPDEIRTL